MSRKRREQVMPEKVTPPEQLREEPEKHSTPVIPPGLVETVDQAPVTGISVAEPGAASPGPGVVEAAAQAQFASARERAAHDLGLAPSDVLAARVDGERVCIVTRGGTKLTWPDDIERAKTLSQPQKDGQWPDGKPANVKAWNEPEPEAKG